MIPWKSAIPQLCSTLATARAPTSSTSEKISLSMMIGFGRGSLDVETASTSFWLTKAHMHMQIRASTFYSMVAVSALCCRVYWSSDARGQVGGVFDDRWCAMVLRHGPQIKQKLPLFADIIISIKEMSSMGLFY